MLDSDAILMRVDVTEPVPVPIVPGDVLYVSYVKLKAAFDVHVQFNGVGKRFKAGIASPVEPLEEGSLWYDTKLVGEALSSGPKFRARLRAKPSRVKDVEAPVPMLRQTCLV